MKTRTYVRVNDDGSKTHVTKIIGNGVMITRKETVWEDDVESYDNENDIFSLIKVLKVSDLKDDEPCKKECKKSTPCKKTDAPDLDNISVEDLKKLQANLGKILESEENLKKITAFLLTLDVDN